MARFTVNSTIFKKTAEKVLTVINKRLPFQIAVEVADGKVKMRGMNGDHCLEVTTDSVWNTEDGAMNIFPDDLETIIKLSGDITVTKTEKKTIKVTAGRKNIILPIADTDILCMPEVEEENKILQFTEGWLYETLSEMSPFASKDRSREIFDSVNLSIRYSQAETADISRVSIRKFPPYSVIGKGENCTLNVMCVHVLKKVLDRKSNSKVVISMDEKHIQFKCKNAVYVIRQMSGTYINTAKLMSNVSEWRFKVNAEKLCEITEYYGTVAARNKVNNFFSFFKYGDKLYSVFLSGTCVVTDELETQDLSFPDDFCIAFNSLYLAQALKIIDTNYPVIRGTNKSTYPLYIDGKNYSFFILPIKQESSLAERVKKQIMEEICE